ncbi:MAG TPA: alpha-2-macroglobulin family protein, partial [Pyrinomonadaceae bacterium]|nr:alpha-2-macroglobulin family protein [Pyrinomonadaceae bacterium]
GNEVTKGDVTLNAFGGFDAAFKLPANMNLGTATVEFETDDDEGDFDDKKYEHSFKVQEFRRPEFEVAASRDNEGELFPGSRADVSVAANYFAGGGLADAEVKWEVTSYATNFTPPNRSDYTFGVWTPWWEELRSGPEVTKEFAGKTDQNGKHRLRIDFDSVNPPQPSVVVAQASVTDVNRQSWTATTSMLVHPADLYVGLKSDRLFVKQGEPLAIHSIVTDLDGKNIVNREIRMRAVRLDWRQLQGAWRQVEVEPQDCTVRSVATDAKCAFKTQQGGVYHVTATIRDDRGRTNESTLTLWVEGGKLPPKRDIDQEKVQLIPDRQEYKAGDIAEVLVQTPFYPTEAIMTLRRSGVLESRRFKMDGPTHTLRVPIQESWTPNVHVQVDLIGAADRSDESENGNSETADVPAKRPAFASGEISLAIPPSTRRLKLVATPRSKTMLPGGQTVVDVEVKDAGGKPVANSEVALVVVDESVLALTDYKIADPVTAFYSAREGGANDYHSRKSLLLASPKALLEEKEQFIRQYWARNAGAMEMNASVSVVGEINAITELPLSSRNIVNLLLLTPGATAGASEKQIRLRENFSALAVFAPSVRTAVNGRARVRVKLPDNLTRYRVIAVAVAGGKQFGAGESAITARLPLMARPSAPRFLNFGDRFELPIVVQNQTNTAISVDVAVRATNAQLFNENEHAAERPGVPLKALTSAGRRVVVPANNRVEVRIPAATVKAGVARFQVAAVSGRWSDAAEISLPVWTPATTEAFATYGEIDEGSVVQPVQAPQNVFPQFGGLELETSSTQLQELTDAVLYLVNYAYGCAEQRASRIIAIAALRDVLTAFKAKDFPSPADLEAKVADDLKVLQGMQNDDGGFGFWKRGEQSWPYLSLHVAHAFARAKQKGFAVPAEMFENSRQYLAGIESKIPAHYSVSTRHAIIAYSLYVRAQMGERDTPRARRLIAEAGLEKLSLEAAGWLLSVLTNDKESAGEVNAIRHLLNNRVTETAGTAHFVCSYSDDDYLILNSNRRADSVILEAIIGDQPKNDLIPKLVRGLLAHRIKGRWENTQENVFTLLALDRYFNTFEKVTPNFVARVWLGDAYAGAQDFKGRSTDRQLVNVPMRYLIENTRQQQPGDVTRNLIVSKEGQGRLYYRIGM